MASITVVFKNARGVNEFVSIVSKHEATMELTGGRFSVDAKNALDIFSLDIKSPLCLTIDSGNCEAITKELEAFIV